MDNINKVLSRKVEEGSGKSPAHSSSSHPRLPTTKLFEGVSSKSSVVVEKQSNTADLKSLAEEITQSLSGFKSLRLSMDRDMKRVVVRVVDEKTDNVVRQIPGDRMVDLIKQMRDLEGVLVKATA
jgi:flagellar protein FlaG